MLTAKTSRQVSHGRQMQLIGLQSSNSTAVILQR